eukprot:jgi/Tetstr1/460890/TSEL_006047.t1
MGATPTSLRGAGLSTHWFKDTSAEVQIYLYIELHKARMLTGKDFFDDPKGPLFACVGKIKDVGYTESGRFSVCLEPHRLGLYKEIRIEVVFERLLLHAIQPPLSFQPRFQSYYAWTLVERNVLAQALRGFADGTINIDDLANINKDFENALPYVDTFAVPPALNGFSNTGGVDWISYGHLRVEIAYPEVKTSHGGDINTLYADTVNVVTDKGTGLPYMFSFPSDKFDAPPPEFEFRSPKLQDCNMVAQSYKRNPSLSAENFSVSFPVYGVSSGEYEPLALTMANFKELVATFEGGEKPRLADASSYKPEIDVIIKFWGSHGALQANIDGSHRREAKRMVKENYPEIYEANKGIRFTSDKMYIGLSPEVCRYMSMKLNEAGHTVVGDTSMHKLLAEELPVMPKGEEVDKDDKVWLNTELCKTCIVEWDFKAPATKQAIADAMSAVRARKATVYIADALFGAGSHTWDSKDAAWGTDDFNDVFAFAMQDTPHNPGA